MKTKAVLFDVDGTLIDTWDFIYGAVKHTVITHGFKMPSEKKIRRGMGNSLMEFYKVVFPTIDPDIFAKTHHNFQQDKFDLGTPFPKVRGVLKRLKQKGILIGAVSNRKTKSVSASLKQAKFLEFFDVIVTPEEVVNTKPHKDHPLKALELLKIKPEEAIMVGDTDFDILAGKSAGIKTVGVSYGFFGKDIKKYKPDWMIDNLEELLKVLKLS